MRIDVVTIFPGYLAPLREALLGRAIERGLVDLAVHDLRTWTHDVHQAVDDAPYGGGPGMVMRPQVWGEALDAVLAADPRPARLVVPTPAGRPVHPGHRAGVGGRAAAGVRLRPLRGHRPAGRRRRRRADAGRRGQHRRLRARRRRGGGAGDGRGGGPAAARRAGQPRVGRSRTRSPTGCSRARPTPGPETWRGLAVPEVLRSGNHAAIARWRRDRALERTAARRPDLLAALPDGALDAADRALLARPRGDGLISPGPAPSGTMDGLPLDASSVGPAGRRPPTRGAAPPHDRDHDEDGSSR